MTDIKDMTIGEAKEELAFVKGRYEELSNLFNQKVDLSSESEINTSAIWVIGKKYLIRTATVMNVGKLVSFNDKELVLSDASWIADSGRWSNILKDGIESDGNSEIEPFKNDVIIGRTAICDATEYDHKLPEKQK